MPFTFLDPATLPDDQLQLRLRVTESAEESMWKVPTYRFDIELRESAPRVGHINLRVGDTHVLTHYVGHIGYGVDEAHRGQHFAERACRLLLPFVKRNGIEILWITCAPDNLASRRTLERLGAEYVGLFDVPDNYPLPPGAIPQKCRYRLELTGI